MSLDVYQPEYTYDVFWPKRFESIKSVDTTFNFGEIQGTDPT